MKIKISILFLIVISVFVSCKKDNQTLQNSSNNNTNNTTYTDPCNSNIPTQFWYPLKLGNQWTYITVLGIIISEITSDTIINGQIFFKFTSITSLPSSPEYYRIDTMNNFIQLNLSLNAEEMCLPANPFIGQTWLRKGKTFLVISLNSDVSTSVCSYTNTLQLEVFGSNGTSQGYFYYKKGLGSVYSPVSYLSGIHISL